MSSLSNQRYTLTSAAFIHPPERQWVIERLYEPTLRAQDAYAVLEDMENNSLSPGHCDPGTLNLLFFSTITLRPTKVLEIGTHIGMGALIIGSALAANNYGKLLTIEPQDVYASAATRYLSAARLDGRVEVLRGYSYDSDIQDRLGREGYFQIVYIDAAHDYASALSDIQLAASLLVENGIMILHDVGVISDEVDASQRGGPRQALRDFCSSNAGFAPVFFEFPLWMNKCGAALVCKQALVVTGAKNA